jgi:hypothetical protein
MVEQEGEQLEEEEEVIEEVSFSFYTSSSSCNKDFFACGSLRKKFYILSLVINNV